MTTPIYYVDQEQAPDVWVTVTTYMEPTTAGRKAQEWADTHKARYRVTTEAGTVLTIKEPTS